MLIPQFLIGSFLIALTVVIHAVSLDYLIRSIMKSKGSVKRVFKRYWKIPLLVKAVLGIFVAHIVQIWIWAIFYMIVGVLPDFEEALYFSTSTFTTVGFGDIYLEKDWRLVSSFQSANGFILFGWSTAFIFEVMSKLYEDDLNHDT
ncbi:MAG: potassium channel family protein [Alphaproteobacteria bacterium]